MIEHSTVGAEIEFPKKRFAKNCKTNSVLFLNAIKPLPASKESDFQKFLAIAVISECSLPPQKAHADD